MLVSQITASLANHGSEFRFHSKWGRELLKDSDQGNDGIWLLCGGIHCKKLKEEDQPETIIVVQVTNDDGLDWG